MVYRLHEKSEDPRHWFDLSWVEPERLQIPLHSIQQFQTENLMLVLEE